jgi:hypothetical protein
VSKFILFMPAVFSHSVISILEDKVSILISINRNSAGLVSLSLLLLCLKNCCAFVIAGFLCLSDGFWLLYLLLLPISKV